MIVTNSDVRIIKGHGTPPDLEDGDIVFDLDGKVWTNDDNGNKIVVADKAGLTDPMVFAPTITVPPLEDTEATISITYMYYSQSGIPKNHVSTDWEVIKTSDNSIVFSSNTTGDNLTSVTITGLEANTEYKIRSKVNMETVSSTWGEITVSTLDQFLPKVDIFEDGSTILLLEFEDNALDTGGIHNGTWNGTAQYSDGVIGRCAKFTGDTNALTYIETDTMTINNFAISAYIQTTDPNQTTMPLYIPDLFFLYFHQGDLYYRYNGTDSYLNNNLVPTDNGWHHYVYKVYDGKCEIWIDGVLKQTVNETIVEKSSTLRVGGSYAAEYNFNGLIDHVRLLDPTDLTEAKIQTLATEKDDQ